MSMFRTVNPRVLEWRPEPGKPLPTPVIQDDREKLPAEVVRAVLQWLDTLKPQFERIGTPTSQTIRVGNGIDGTRNETPTKVRVMFNSGVAAQMQGVEFTAGTFQMLLKDRKHGPIDATYQYLGCKDSTTGLCIVGPLLGIEQTRTLQVN